MTSHTSEFTMCCMTDLSLYNLETELMVGSLKRIGQFEVLRTLGDGSYSTVHVCRDLESRTYVAMKTLKANNFRTHLSKEVYREITLLKSLTHKNIVKLNEIVLNADMKSLCLSLEYCPYPLDRFIQCYAGKIPVSEIKCAAKDLFRGLCYLHKNYILHRDLKPSNLFINEEGILKIGDFGLSKRFNLQQQQMSPNVITRCYQPPELLLEYPTYGAEADVWSAACIVAEMYIKRPLFQGETQITQINLIIDTIGSPNTSHWPELKDCKVWSSLNFKSQPHNRLRQKCHDFDCSNVYDLLSQVLVYNPINRLKAKECYEHEWFQKVPFAAKTIELTNSLMNKISICNALC